MIAGTIEIQMLADMARLQADMNKANQIVGDSMAAMQGAIGIVTKALVAFAGVASIEAFAGMIRGNIEAAAAMGKLATQAGVTVEALSGLNAVGKLSGTSADTIAGAMNKMTKAVAGTAEDAKGAGAAITALGMNFDDFSKMSPDERMVSVAKAMDKFQDGSGKSAAAMYLMGKAGAEMLPYMKDLALAGELHAKVTTAQAAAARDFENNLKRVTATSDAWKKELSMGMLPALDEASQAYLAVMNGAGGFRDEIIKLSRDGSIAEWTRMAINDLTYLMDAFEYLWRAIKGVGEAIGAFVALWVSGMVTIGGVVSKVLSGDIGGAIDEFRASVERGKTIASEFGTSVIDSFKAQTIGEKFRQQLQIAEQVKVKNLLEYQEKVQQVLAAYAKFDVKVQQAAMTALATNYFGADKPQVDIIPPEKKAAIDKNVTAYQALVKAIQEKTATDLLDIQTQGRLTEGQKEAAKIKEDLRTGTLKLTDAQQTYIAKLLELRLATEQQKISEDAAMKQTTADALARQALKNKEYDDINKYFEAQQEARNKAEQLDKDQLKAAQDLYDQYGKTKSQIEELVIAELKLKAERINVDNDEKQSLLRQIELRQKLTVVLANTEELDRQKAIWQSIEQTAHTTFTNIFEGGQDAFTKLRDTLKATLLDLLYQMTVKRWIFDITASVSGSGVAAAAIPGMTGEGASSLSSLSSIYSVGSKGYNYVANLLNGGATAGSGVAVSAASTASTGAVMGGTEVGGAAGIGSGTTLGGAGATGASSAGFAGIPVVGWIAMGMIASGNAYDMGFRSGNKGGTGFTVSDGDMLGVNGTINGTDRILQGLGVDGKTAAILSGSALGAQAMYTVLGGYQVSPAGQFLAGSVGGAGTSLQTRTDYTQDHRGPLGIGSYTTHNSDFSAADPGAVSYVDQAVKVVQASVKVFASTLGLSVDAIDSFSKSIEVSLGGLDAAGQKDAIDKAITGFMNDMVTALYGDQMKALAISGEDSSTTLARVATQFLQVNDVMDLLGGSLLKVGIDGATAADSLVKMMGGLASFQASTADYAKNFLTSAEQRAAALENISATMRGAGVNVSAEQVGGMSRADVAAYVRTLDLTTDAGRRAFAAVMSVESAFASLTPTLDAVGQAAAAAAAQNNALMQNALANYGTSAEQRDFAIMQIQSGLNAGGVNLTADQIGSATRMDARDLYTFYANQHTTAGDAAAHAILTEADAFAKLTANTNTLTGAIGGGGGGGGGGASGAIDSLANAIASLVDNILKERDRLLNEITGNGPMGVAEAQMQFAMATAQARAGDQKAAAALPGLSQALDTLAMQNAHTEVELNLIRGRMANSLNTTAGVLNGGAVPAYIAPSVAASTVSASTSSSSYSALQAQQAAPTDMQPDHSSMEQLLQQLIDKVSALQAPTETTAEMSTKVKKILVNVTNDGDGMKINSDSISGAVIIEAS